MNRILYILIFVFTFFNHNIINAQEVVIDTLKSDNNYIFSSEHFKNDYDKIISLSNEYEYNHRIWSKKILDNFPLNDNGIVELRYKIKSNRIIDIKKLMEVSADWFSYAFSSINAITKFDNEGILKGKGTYINISQYNINAIYYAKTVRINIDVNIGIKINDNDIDFIALVKHYRVISGDSLMNSENSLILISNTFPNIESDNKIAYARAFINTHANLFALISDYIDFINNNTNKDKNDLNFIW